MDKEKIEKARISAEKGRKVWPLLDLPDMLDQALDEVEAGYEVTRQLLEYIKLLRAVAEAAEKMRAGIHEVNLTDASRKFWEFNITDDFDKAIKALRDGGVG